MAVSIREHKMSSSHSRHTARLVTDTQYTWEVSWLPGRDLNRNQAVTAMVLADTTADSDVHSGHRLWPHIEVWAAELGMSGSQALGRVAGPPRWARRQQGTAEPLGHARLVGGPGIAPLDPDPVVVGWIEDPDPVDLGWADEYDLPSPEYPDPSWPGFIASRRRHPDHLSDRDVNNWHMERHPDTPASLPGALRPGGDLDAELAMTADPEAGE